MTEYTFFSSVNCFNGITANLQSINGQKNLFRDFCTLMDFSVDLQQILILLKSHIFTDCFSICVTIYTSYSMLSGSDRHFNFKFSEWFCDIRMCFCFCDLTKKYNHIIYNGKCKLYGKYFSQECTNIVNYIM